MSNGIMFGRRDVLRLGGMTALAGLLPGFGAVAFAQGAAALKPASIINAGGDTTLVLQEMVKHSAIWRGSASMRRRRIWATAPR